MSNSKNILLERTEYIIKKYLNYNKHKILTYIVPDMTKHIFSLFSLFSYVNIIFDNANDEILINKYKTDNCRIFNGKINKILKEMSHELIIIQCTNNNFFTDNGLIYIDDMELSDIVNNYGQTLIFHVPKDYNLDKFINNIKYNDVELYGQSDHNNGYFICIKK